MRATLSTSRVTAQRAQQIMTVIVVLLMIISTLVALARHLPADANGGAQSGLQRFLNGTEISPPAILLALFVVFTALAFLSHRWRVVGLIGTLGVALLCLVALLAITSDPNWRQLLSPAHFDLLLSPLALVAFVALLPTAIVSTFSGVQQIRMLRRQV